MPPCNDGALFQYGVESYVASDMGYESCSVSRISAVTGSKFTLKASGRETSSPESVQISMPLSASPSPSGWSSQPRATATPVFSVQSRQSPSECSQITAAATPVSPAQTHQSSSAGAAKMRELVIALVVAIVTPIALIVLGLSYICVTRRRRRSNKHNGPAETSPDQAEGEAEVGQLYLQQKTELDDEQRRHEMEAIELRYEMDGADEIPELPGERDIRCYDRQELRGEEFSKELDALS